VSVLGKAVRLARLQNPIQMSQALKHIIHHGASVDEAMGLLASDQGG